MLVPLGGHQYLHALAEEEDSMEVFCHIIDCFVTYLIYYNIFLIFLQHSHQHVRSLQQSLLGI